MKQIIYDIVDTHAYITTNCFQHQLSEILDEEFIVKRIEIADLQRNHIPDDSVVLSRLKLRTLYKNLDIVAMACSKTKFFVYEQDTWENFLIDSPYYGSYKAICNKIPVISFFNMSHWWSDLVNSCGIPSKFIQVWMLPRYCISTPIPWSERKHNVIFCGTMYPHRKAFFDKLTAEGVNVEIVPAGKDYASYLDLLSNSKIAIRSELINWNIDSGSGANIINRPNAQWQRDIECAARGCFSMREPDDEAKLWDIEKIATISPFTSVKEAAMIINTILKTDDRVIDAAVEQSINFVRNGIGWKTVANAIKTSLNMEV